MKTQLQSYYSNYDKGYNDPHASRWLYKRDPELWDLILEATDFLPHDAKAKQRCWHILHDVYTRPTCPITGNFSKWRDFYYSKYYSHSAKASDPKVQAKVCKSWKNDDVRKAKVRNTFKQNRAAGKHIIVDSPFKNSEVQEKCKTTMLERYGYANNFYCSDKQKEMRKWMTDDEKFNNARIKAKQTRIKNGWQIPDELKTDRELYLAEVAKVTERNYKQYKHIINPDDVPRTYGKYHLDHIFSKHEGFLEGIDPEIIGHYSNLRMLWHSDNESKNFRSDKTKEQLFEDYKRVD